VTVEASRLALTVLLLLLQSFITDFTNQYVYIIPVAMMVSEWYVHFYAGRPE